MWRQAKSVLKFLLAQCHHFFYLGLQIDWLLSLTRRIPWYCQSFNLTKKPLIAIVSGFSSYLLGCSQVTEIDSILSTINKILCCVPQGSVLGPLLFLIYVFTTLQINFLFIFLQMTQICCLPTKISNVMKKRSMANWWKSWIAQYK